MAGIIKAGPAKTIGTGSHDVSFNFEDLSHKADAYLESVRSKAADILGQAQREAELVRQRAVEQGREAALLAAVKTVRAEVERQVASLMPALEAAIQEIRQAKESWRASWEQRALDVAFEIAQHVVLREVGRTPEITLDLIREALELASGCEQIQVRLHPSDHTTLAELAQPLATRICGLAPTTVVSDPEVQPGGCRIETPLGAIDQQLSTRLARIREELGHG